MVAPKPTTVSTALGLYQLLLPTQSHLFATWLPPTRASQGRTSGGRLSSPTLSFTRALGTRTATQGQRHRVPQGLEDSQAAGHQQTFRSGPGKLKSETFH